MTSRAKRGTCVSVLALLLAGTAQAQDAPSCLQRLDHPTADSLRSTFAVTVQSFNPRRPIPTTYAELFGQGLRLELKLPPNLVLPVFEADSVASSSSPQSKQWMAVPSMSVGYGVTVDSGKIVRIRRIAGASHAAFDMAVARAFVVLDSSGMLPPLPESIGSAPLEISVAVARVPARQVPSIIPESGAPTVPLFIVRSPAHVVDTPIKRGADFAQFIPQPPTKREDEGVSVRIVVGPDGVAEQTSMQVVAYSSAGYIKNVFEMIPNWHFQPMVLQGCPVPALEELTFTATQKESAKP